MEKGKEKAVSEKEKGVYRLCAQKLHLTYKGHLDFTKLDEFVEEKCGRNNSIRKKEESLFRSVVWESSDQETSYDHTHYLVWFVKKVDSRNAGIFDFEGIHPNIQCVKTDGHWINTWKYHEKNPVKLEPQPHDDPSVEDKGNIPMKVRIKTASSLWEACEIMGVEPRSVSDVNMLRKDKEKREASISNFPTDSFIVPETWNENFKCVVLYGPSGTGKTEFALSRFECPLLITHMDSLRLFDPDMYDGIVFDDMSFNHIPREAAIHLVDWTMSRDIHCRHYNAFIPKHTRKIFTTNVSFGQIFPLDEYGAIKRRVSWVEVKNNLWDDDIVFETEVLEAIEEVTKTGGGIGGFSDSDGWNPFSPGETPEWAGMSYCGCAENEPRSSDGLCRHRKKYNETMYFKYL